MQGNKGPTGNPQARGNPNQTEGAEGLVGQATEAARNVADSASDLARDTYDAGARYVRDTLPEAGRYVSEGSRAVSRPIEENPLIAILAAGAAGYLVAYLIHGGGMNWGSDTRSGYGRSRGGRHRSF